MLLNDINTINESWPNTGTGWGRAWLDGNLSFSGTMSGGDDARRLRRFERPNAAGLKNDQTNQYTIDNVTAGKELRATLVWFDPAAVPGAAVALRLRPALSPAAVAEFTSHSCPAWRRRGSG